MLDFKFRFHAFGVQGSVLRFGVGLGLQGSHPSREEVQDTAGRGSENTAGCNRSSCAHWTQAFSHAGFVER